MLPRTNSSIAPHSPHRMPKGQKVLHTPVSGPSEDFFDSGGDSLKAITLIFELEQALGLELPLTLINEAPTFASLCDALREQRTTRYVPLVLLKAGDGLAPLFFIHGLGGDGCHRSSIVSNACSTHFVTVRPPS